MERVFDTKGDLEVISGVAKALGKECGDSRMADMFKFSDENDTQEYLQRIINASATLKGYKIESLEEKAKVGIPTLMNNRTYPRISSYEQARSEIGRAHV